MKFQIGDKVTIKPGEHAVNKLLFGIPAEVIETTGNGRLYPIRIKMTVDNKVRTIPVAADEIELITQRPMSHEEILNRILSLTCVGTEKDENGYSEYSIETHCVNFVIVARPGDAVIDKETLEWDYCEFEIKEMRIDNS